MLVRPEDVITDINERLNTLCRTLGRDSLNYAADIQLYASPGMAGSSVAEIVTTAVGHNVVVGGAEVSGSSTLVESLKAGLEYSGDDGSHPNRAFLSGVEFSVRKDEVLACFRDFLKDADRVVSFWLKEGHPFYPVFWDFAYMIEKGDDAYVFIGSSSD